MLTQTPGTEELARRMASDVEVASAPPVAKPKLVFFHSPRSGRCRRVEGFIAQVLQRRKNHDSFHVVRVSVADRPDLADRFRVDEVPTLAVVEDGKLVKRIRSPRGCREIEQSLDRWLR